ncbi:MAG: hypothetical protein AAFX06_16715 [Planctomycetota bacterium]
MRRLAIAACSVLFSVSAFANTLTFDDLNNMEVPRLPPFADIFVTNVDYDFDATTDELTVVGDAVTFRSGGITDDENENAFQPVSTGFVQDSIVRAGIGVGEFTLTAFIDDAGALSSGSFTVIGSVLPFVNGVPDFTNAVNFPENGPLLTGDLETVVFDSTGSSSNLFFRYDVSGGAAAIPVLPNGNEGFRSAGTHGIIAFSGADSFTGSWSDSFTDADANNFADIGVPVPSSMSLLASLVLFGCGRRTRRSRSVA